MSAVAPSWACDIERDEREAQIKAMYDVRRLCPESRGQTTETVWYEVAKIELQILRQEKDKRQYLNSLAETVEKWRPKIKPQEPQMIPMPEHLATESSPALDSSSPIPSISSTPFLPANPPPSPLLPLTQTSVDNTRVYWEKHSELRRKYVDRMVKLRRIFKKALSAAVGSKQQRLQNVVGKLQNALEILATKPESSEVHFKYDVQTLHQLQAQIEKKFVPIMNHYAKKLEAKKRNAEAEPEVRKQSPKRARTSPTAKENKPNEVSAFSLTLSPGNEPSQTPYELNTRIVHSEVKAAVDNVASAQAVGQPLAEASASMTVSI